jgi:hypothetical protein
MLCWEPMIYRKENQCPKSYDKIKIIEKAAIPVNKKVFILLKLNRNSIQPASKRPFFK